MAVVCYRPPKSVAGVWFTRCLRYVVFGMACVGMGLYVATPVFAQSSGAISQSYQTEDKDISMGALVGLTTSGSDQVKPATVADASRLVGVAVSQPALELSATTEGGSLRTVQIAVGGTTDVLVSDANGTVKAGDKITISPLAGIGMKALSAGEIVGTAQASLSSVETVTQQFKGTDGRSVTVRVGLVPVAVNVAYYAATGASGNLSAFVPLFLQNLANAVAGKAVSPLRVIVGMIALLLGFAAVITMLSIGVRSGIISLGRNPLAAGALRKGMVDVLIGAVGVLLVTCVIVGAVILT